MKIAVGGSAANPPHFGHKKLVEAIIATGDFEQVRWIVSGDRPDKPGMISSFHRWQMGKMLFGDISEPIVLYESECAVPTRDVIANLGQCYPSAGIVWYCGADHFVPRERFGGKCDVLGFWHGGEKLFCEQDFLIIPRAGIDMNCLQLPMRHKILNVEIPEISSTKIRKRIIANKSIDYLVGDGVADYILANELFI